MTILTVTSEGEVILDRKLLETLDIAPGDQLIALPQADGGLSLSRMREKAVTTGEKVEGGLDAFFGSLRNRNNLHLTLDEINDAIEDGWASGMRLNDDR